MDTVLSVCLGIGLAAACGFRIFVPFLLMNLAARAGYLTLAGGFDWIGSTPALVLFAVATVLEIAAYYVPWVDNALDTVAGPLAVVAGVVMMASAITGMSPLLKWTLALIAGGGAAGLVAGLTGTARGASTLTTGGAANFLVASAEAVGSVLLSLLAMALPLVAAVTFAVAVFLTFRWLATRASRRAPEAVPSG